MSGAKDRKEITVKELILKLQHWCKYLISRWYVILIMGIVGATTGFFYAKTSTPIYTATTTFVLESGAQGGVLGQYAGMAAMVGIDLEGKGGEGIFQGDNLLELYKSRKMIESALLMPSQSDSSLLLMDRYLTLNKTKDLWKEKTPELLKIAFNGKNPPKLERARDSIVNQAVININKNNLVVGKLDPKLSIIKVDIKSEDEVFSKEFNEALVIKVNDFYTQTKTKKSLTNIVILQHKTDSVRSVMDGNISAGASVIDATPNLNPTRQAQRLVPTQKLQISAEANRAILTELVKNLEMSKMGLLQDSPLIQQVDSPIYPLEQKKIGKLKGIVSGAFIFGFLTTIILMISKLFKSIMDQ